MEEREADLAKRRNFTHLGFRKIDEITLILGKVLGRPLLFFALILEDLDLVFATEIVAAAAAAHVRHYCGASDGHRRLLLSVLSRSFCAAAARREGLFSRDVARSAISASDESGG